MDKIKDKKSILGRGLDELFDSKTESLSPRELKISNIQPGNSQPRKVFDKDKIQQLAASIRETGLIQPIVVRLASEGQYTIIAGERRWLAAKEAGLEIVPVVVKSLNDREALKIAIIENIQREDLNILEEAEAYQRLMAEYNYTQDMVASQIGKSRSHVANTLRLLTLPDEIKEFLINGQISPGHARALINNENGVETAKEIIKNKLNVRDVEKRHKQVRQEDGQPCDEASIKQRLEEKTQAKIINLILKKNGSVQVSLIFDSLWSLEDFMAENKKS